MEEIKEQKKKPCTTCKKKGKVTKLEVMEEPVSLFDIPSLEDIKLAYAELTSFGGVKKEKKEQIEKIYKFLFNEDFDWNCRSCISNQARKFHNHMKYNLKLI
jgi:hypothetical protein